MTLLVTVLSFLHACAATEAQPKSGEKCLSHHGVNYILNDSKSLAGKWGSLASKLTTGESSESALDDASSILEMIESQIALVRGNLTGINCLESGRGKLLNSTHSLLATVRGHLDQYFEAAISVTGKSRNELADPETYGAEQSSETAAVELLDTDISRKSGEDGENSGSSRSGDSYDNDGYKYQGGHVSGDESGSRTDGNSAYHSAVGQPAKGYQPAHGQPRYQEPQYQQPQYQPQYQQPQYQQPQYQQPQYQQPQYQPQYQQPQYQRPGYYQQPPYRPANQPQYGQPAPQPYGQGYGQYGGYAQPAYNPSGQYGSQQGLGGFAGRVLRFTEQLVGTLFHQLEEIGSIFVIVGGQGSMELVQDTERQVRNLAGSLHLL